MVSKEADPALPIPGAIFRRKVKNHVDIIQLLRRNLSRHLCQVFQHPVIILFIWRIIPWFTIIIYSGLLNISKEYYEAATVDGAGVLQQFWYITIPLLKNILFFCALTVTIDIWKMFNESYTLSGPGTSNTSLFQLVYENGFKSFNLGYASALSVVLILVLLVISMIQYRLRRSEEGV